MLSTSQGARVTNSTTRPARSPRVLTVLLVVLGLFGCLQTASAEASYPMAAPGDLLPAQLNSSSMQLSWGAVAGAPGYKVRVYAKGTTTRFIATPTNQVKLTGLKKDTLYYIRAWVEEPAGERILSDNSPEVLVTTSGYTRFTPDQLTVTKQTSSSVAMKWSPVAGLGPDDQYMLEYATDAAITAGRKTAGPFSTTSGSVTALASNATYFAKVYVVDSSRVRISGSSTVVTAKSLVPRGTIAGRVSGASGGDLQALAYDSSAELAGQASVSSDGTYRLSVRPGTYQVQLAYLGTSGVTSLWATTGKAGSLVPSAATRIEVTEGATAEAPEVRVDQGATVSGTVKDSAGNTVRDVYVTALTATTSEREVVDSAASVTSYTIEGLPAGSYWLRYIYSGDGFKTYSKAVTVPNGGQNTIDVTLANADFRSSYKAYVSGTKKVGSTLKVSATPWLAGSYPTTRAAMSFQWKRNGAAIAGATSSSYKLTSSDRGKTISVTATARRYGYNTDSTTSTGYKVS